MSEIEVDLPKWMYDEFERVAKSTGCSVEAVYCFFLSKKVVHT